MNRLVFVALALFASVSARAQQTPYLDRTLSVEQRIDDLLSRMTIEEKCKQMVNSTPAIARLGIPPYDWWNESLHGVARNGRATIFPQPIGLGATFDEDLLFRVADAISDEARAKFNITQAAKNYSQYAGLTFWSPNVNIFRDPRWGRGMETYGEDPCLTSQLGVAYVKGMQGDDPVYLKTSACAKHFAVHSGPEALRHEFDVSPSKKDLYETYLPAFKALVTQANVDAVMGAYNRVYGESASAHKLLLGDILRDKWHFKGHVVTDCGALDDIHLYHKITANAVESAALAVKKGVNLNCGSTYRNLPEAVRQGLVTQQEIDNLLRPLLRTRFRLGMFDPKEFNPYASIPDSVVGCTAHRELSREAAQKSMVLLQNKNNVLPLSKNLKKIYVTGPFAADVNVLMGNYYGMSENCSTFLEGIVATADKSTTVDYKQGAMPLMPRANPIDWVTNGASASNAIIVVMGVSTLCEGEEGDAIASADMGDRPTLEVPKNQMDFLETLSKSPKRKCPLIVVLTGGSPIITDKIAQLADAVIMAWYPGQEGGLALADIIFGNTSPSGKLPVTFPLSVSQLPEYTDYSMRNRTYRYMTDAPMYPFGFGLTYADFDISNLSLSSQKIKRGEALTARVEVKNNSEVKAQEVVQLYISLPGAGRDNPLWSLAGFKRVDLNGGRSVEVEFEITPEMLTTITSEGTEVQRKGQYKLIVGNGSPSQRSAQLGVKTSSATFEVK